MYMYNMPYARTRRTMRRKRTTSRRNYALRKKRTFRSRNSRVKRSVFSTRMQNSYYYDRWQPVISATVAQNSTYTFVGQSFSLSDLSSSDLAFYQGLFDQYRIIKVSIAFRALTNPEASFAANTTSTNNANSFYSDIYAAVDHDDANAPTSVEQMQEYGRKVKTGVLKANTWFIYSFRPTPQNLIYNGVNSAYGVPMRTPFINCTYSAVPHYGLKYAIGSPFTNVQPMTFEYRLRFAIKFINTH